MLPKTATYLYLTMIFCSLTLAITISTPAQTEIAEAKNVSTIYLETAVTDGTVQLYLPLILKPVTSLSDLITITTVTLPTPLEGSAGSWCTMTGCTIGPRLYHAPLTNDDTLIGWTDQDGNGHITLVGTSPTQHWDFPGTAVKGLVAHPDNSFAVTLWDSNAESIFLSRRSAAGGEVWTTNLNSTIAEADFWLGDGRLDYGDGTYAAYFTVQGTSGGFDGHHGDQLAYVSDLGDIKIGGWDWGCSHSMAQLVTFHPNLNQFAAVCSADCFPDKSIHWVNASHQIYQGDGNCGGLVSTQLGQMALSEQTWKLVFNAIEQPCCEGKGIALATLDENQQSSTIWLTNSAGEYERDPAIARLGTTLGSNRFLVGWMTLNDNGYWLGVIDEGGTFLMGPENVALADVSWGNRDESFRTRPDGTVSWVQADANGSVINLYRFDGDSFLP